MTFSKLDTLVERHPVPNWRITAWPVMFLLVFVLIWASFMTIKEVRVAHGVFVSPLGVKTIQHLEGGIVEGIHVSEGQVVNMDAPLILINLAKTGVNREELQVRLDEQFLLKAPYDAEAQGKNNFEYSDELAERLPKKVIVQRQNFNARRQKLTSSSESLVQTIKQRREELKEQEGQLRAVTNNFRLGVKRFEMSKNLLNDGLVSETEHLQLEAELQSLKVQHQSLKSSVPLAKAAVSLAQKQLDEKQDRFRSIAQKKLFKIEQTIDNIQMLLASSDEQGTRTMIRSPIDGVVKKMKFNNIGQVVRPGEPIMEIVPKGASLVIDAKLNPADRAFAVLNQPAVAKLSAYDYVRFGGLEGHVTMVAPVASIDEKGKPYFKVLVQTYKSYLGSDPKLYKITPGMEATVDIQTGERSLMEFLFMPILQLNHESSRER
jgi:membrane fusion protein, adhesin transport system